MVWSLSIQCVVMVTVWLIRSCHHLVIFLSGSRQTGWWVGGLTWWVGKPFPCKRDKRMRWRQVCFLSLSLLTQFASQKKWNSIFAASENELGFCVFSSSNLNPQNKFTELQISSLLLLRQMLSQKLLKVVQTCFPFNCFYFCTSFTYIMSIEALSWQMSSKSNIFLRCSPIDLQVYICVIGI